MPAFIIIFPVDKKNAQFADLLLQIHQFVTQYISNIKFYFSLKSIHNQRINFLFLIPTPLSM